MIIYRPNRALLADAMSEARVFHNRDEMRHFICDTWEVDCGRRMFEPEDIVIDEESIVDDRNGWNDTRYVCVKRMGNDVYDCPQCIGMCATDFQKARTNNA